jgi:23S rRNA (uracil1939-C5)-methyltransferase
MGVIMNDVSNLDAPELATLHVEKIVTGGSGLSRHDGTTVFVPLAAPGDEVRVRLGPPRRNHRTGEIDTVITPGPDRCPPPCPHFGDCGGCQLQHLTATGQRDAKTDIVADCFRRLGGIDVADRIEPPDPDLPEFHYRTKARLFASPEGPYGFRRRASHRIVPLTTCRLLPEIFDAEILPWLRTLPPAEQLVLRFDERGQWLLSIYGPSRRMRVLKQMVAQLPAGEPPAPGCAGLQYNNRPVWGRDYLVVACAERKFRVGAQSFFQANLAVAARAVERGRAWLDELAEPGSLLLDLYCGVGLFGVVWADRFKRVLAADTDPHAVRDAQNNVRRDRVAKERVRVVPRAADALLSDRELLPAAAALEACCVVDPPRAGLGAATCRALTEAAARTLLYLSCDPATLARDARELCGGGYAVRRVAVLDMFPQTSHVETLVLLTRD